MSFPIYQQELQERFARLNQRSVSCSNLFDTVTLPLPRKALCGINEQEITAYDEP